MKILAAAAAAVLAACGSAATSPGQPQAQAGERAYAKCYSCHALDPGPALSGPSLYRIVGRRVASEPGFDYSPALKRFAERNPVWTRALVGRFAADPEALVPGTNMAFHGMADPNERAALLDYLERAGR